MIDLAEIWKWLRAERGQAERTALVLPAIMTSNTEFFDDFVLPARIMVENDEFYGPMFQFHPRPDIASPKSWAWVVAVRSGALHDLVRMRDDARTVQSWWRSQNRDSYVKALDFALHVLTAFSSHEKEILDSAELRVLEEWRLHQKRLVLGADAPFDVSFLHEGCEDFQAYGIASGEARGAAFSKAQEALAFWHGDLTGAATMEALLGREIHDLVAVSANFSKVLGRFLGHSTVLGYPQEPEIEERPVRLFRDLKGFIEGFCGGVLLIGDPRENYRWLAKCDGGIITDDIAHGKTIKKILTRPYRGPQVLVAQ